LRFPSHNQPPYDGAGAAYPLPRYAPSRQGSYRQYRYTYESPPYDYDAPAYSPHRYIPPPHEIYREGPTNTKRTSTGHLSIHLIASCPIGMGIAPTATLINIMTPAAARQRSNWSRHGHPLRSWDRGAVHGLLTRRKFRTTGLSRRCPRTMHGPPSLDAGNSGRSLLLRGLEFLRIFLVPPIPHIRSSPRARREEPLIISLRSSWTCCIHWSPLGTALCLALLVLLVLTPSYGFVCCHQRTFFGIAVFLCDEASWVTRDARASLRSDTRSPMTGLSLESHDIIFR
jgi:hypothetical protein